MRSYAVVIHAPVPPEDGSVVERVGAALGARGLEVGELRTEDGPHDATMLHVESTVEAPSAYVAEQISGPELFRQVLEDAGLTLPRQAIAVSVVLDGA